ncbi:MAG TPA: SgcJ/EcaC family oxidoreductase [Candidatus Angelobacter sp.]|nr:SgcJ/EcaC family oxidoreductase [Candidatus Angelobacter sp.]
MKFILTVLGSGLLAAVTGFASAQAGAPAPKQAATIQAGTAEDEAAVRAIINHWQQNWEDFDASVLAGDYADDADWQNAFGVRLKGGAKIVEFVSTVVKRATVQGRHTTWGEPSVRFLRPDVALAYRDYTTVGHKILNGQEMPRRNTHSTWILTKDGGKWRIASHVICDDNAAAASPAK